MCLHKVKVDGVCKVELDLQQDIVHVALALLYSTTQCGFFHCITSNVYELAAVKFS